MCVCHGLRVCVLYVSTFVCVCVSVVVAGGHRDDHAINGTLLANKRTQRVTLTLSPLHFLSPTHTRSDGEVSIVFLFF